MDHRQKAKDRVQSVEKAKANMSGQMVNPDYAFQLQLAVISDALVALTHAVLALGQD